MKDDLAALKWQVEMGADEAIEDSPVSTEVSSKKQEVADNPAPQPVAAPEPVKTAPKAAPKSAASDAPLTVEARKLADSAKNLDELRQIVTDYKELAICKTATNVVFSDGNPKADVMFIGEAPGAQEDEQGIPFCGPSGQLLDKMIGYVGFNRESTMYISNTVFWRPPGNRRPTPEELAVCLPFVEKHIALVNPKALILIGGTATLSLMDTKDGISKLRGKEHSYTNQYLDKEIPTFAVFHPSYLLRQPRMKKTMWFDLLSIQEFLQK